MELLTQIGTMISAVIAAGTLVFFVVDRSAKLRARVVSDWQKLAVYDSIRSATPRRLTYDEIKLSYKAAYADFGSKHLLDGKLSDADLKTVLYSLLKDRTIDLQGSDSYGIQTKLDFGTDFGNSMGPFLGSFAPVISNAVVQMQLQDTQNQLRAATLRAVVNSPNVYNLSEIAVKISRELSHDYDDTKIFIMRLVNEGLLTQDGEGRIGMKLMRES